ncbi:MAG: pilus assembly protein [Caldilineaceae bacterium]|nr:pilus assembly protein [Caldilineaceae bacterium]
MTAFKAHGRPSGLFSSSQGDMVEAAVTMPLLLLVTFALINFALVGHARNSAQNAANHGARVGAVTASGAGSAATQEAERLMANCFCTYSVTVSAANAPGGTVTVAVAWTVPSYMDGFLQVMGGSAQGDFSGTVSASHRKEGW